MDAGGFVMELEKIREEIDAIDPELRKLLMRRLNASYEVARAKKEAGSFDIFRADREEAILSRLGEGIPEDRKAGYLAVVRKIMETSRMYQYGLLYDWTPGLFQELFGDLAIAPDCSRVRVRLTREDRPNAMSAILSMIGDRGFNMERMELTYEDKDAGTVTFELVICGDLNRAEMQKLMFQLSKESKDFAILETF
jgi:chorismate mutase/acetolactate synthase regulatory subunit